MCAPGYFLGTENGRCGLFAVRFGEQGYRRRGTRLHPISCLIYDLVFLYFRRGLSFYTSLLSLDNCASSRALFPFCSQLRTQTGRQKIKNLELRSFRPSDTNAFPPVQIETVRIFVSGNASFEFSNESKRFHDARNGTMISSVKK